MIPFFPLKFSEIFHNFARTASSRFFFFFAGGNFWDGENCFS